MTFLKIVGGSRANGNEVHRFEAADGTILTFRPMGTDFCAGRCAFVEEMIEPDGTSYRFEYSPTGVAGTPVRLSKVTSSRGFALLLEGMSGSLVGKACILNLALTPAPPAGAACPANALATARYGYEGGRLVTAIPPSGDSSASRFAYTVGADNKVSRMEFRKPGESQPWLANALGFSADEEGAGQEIVLSQAFADGQTYDYSYVRTPVPAAYSDHFTIAGGSFRDSEGRETIVRPAFPYMPGSRSNLCYGLPPAQCGEKPLVTNETVFTYQQTPGPVEITDPLGRTTTMDYCDEATAAGLPAGEIDRCSVTRMQSSVDPEGIKTRYAYDGRNNITKVTRYPKPGVASPGGSTPAPVTVEAEYDIHNVRSQSKPLWIKDANGNFTRWAYAPEHGGVLTETGPAVDGVTPQKRNAYVQRQARLWDGSAAGPPVWLLERTAFCRTGNPAASGAGCAAGAADEVVTAYDYGPDSGPNNLLLRGQAVTADGQTLRTCFAYDAQGRKISETSPGGTAGLSACPGAPPTSALPYTSSIRYDGDGQVTGTIAPDPD
ncbi:MAG TPA: hypothetical protein VF650_01775, partial [Allosphingosinicella sp.]